MDAEHFPLSRGSRQSTGTAVKEDKKHNEHSVSAAHLYCTWNANFSLYKVTAETPVRFRFTINTLRLTFFWAAVLCAWGEVLEAIGVALAATVIKGLTLHGGHVEEVAVKQAAAGSLLFGKPTDLGNLWGEEWQDLRLGLEQDSKVIVYLVHKTDKP